MRKDVREIVEQARAWGFEVGDLDGQGHYPARHPNGGVERIPATPSEYRWRKNCLAALRRIAGVPAEGSAGRYTNRDRGSDFSIERAKSEQEKWQARWGPRLAHTTAEIAHIDARLVQGDPVRQHDVLCKLLRRREELCEELAAMNQPIPDLPQVAS